ncbi:hypothetical protein HPB50_015661 [Hyalomma asiaticum]|uniref:Uncharacterized protein n=1 Tax=Hyalomma asiaticum TaxID=266040 RepID=A0ACB7TKX5_HYAAI|nr:hypothetical protein HPB50_015661 [Hyalomma asiaticum]
MLQVAASTDSLEGLLHKTTTTRRGGGSGEAKKERRDGLQETCVTYSEQPSPEFGVALEGKPAARLGSGSVQPCESL